MSTKLLKGYSLVGNDGQEVNQAAILDDGAAFRVMRGGEPVTDPFTTVAEFMGKPVFSGDVDDHFRGLAVAALLDLRPIRLGEDKGRFRTSYGTKTPAGLWRSILSAANVTTPAPIHP
jgi:hypothetical protein